MNDLISRQAAIDAVGIGDSVRRIKDRIAKLPSAQPDHFANVSEKVNLTAEKKQNVSDSDLISRKAAIEALGEEPEVWHDSDDYELGQRSEWVRYRGALEDLPSADVVCVVRCRDCVHFSDANNECGTCGFFEEARSADHFCGEAERREFDTPCDMCVYSPPSTADGKPCAVCPAEGRNNG